MTPPGSALRHIPGFTETPPIPTNPTPNSPGTNDQVQSLADGLQRLDYYLHNVTNEQRYLSSRTERHLQTVRSTHSRALWYYVALYGVIVAASFAQVSTAAGVAPGGCRGVGMLHDECGYREASALLHTSATQDRGGADT